jgi:hypothetical protein
VLNQIAWTYYCYYYDVVVVIYGLRD